MTASDLARDVPQRPNSEVTNLLRATTAPMAEILSARRLCARITLAENSILIGHSAESGGDPVEFLFASANNFKRVVEPMRLFDLALGYLDGRMKILGPISRAVDILDAINDATDRPRTILELSRDLVHRGLKALVPGVATRFESLGHYSQDPKAYELFLDDFMQYSCGRFENGSEDINQAQLAKFRMIAQLVTRHCGPPTGKDHLDMGCGWGGLGAYFTNQLGMRTVCNTNVESQRRYAQGRFGCDVTFGDFSQLRATEKRFDLITIVGMMEHLTPRRRSQALDIVTHLLKPDGIVFLQCITKPQDWIGGDAYRLARQEIFPGHFLETHQQTEARLKQAGFTILESMDHTSDYALTTSRWVDRIQANEAALTSILGARQYRAFLGYLAVASRLFHTRRGQLMRYVVRRA